MGCVSMKSSVKKIKIDLAIKQRKIQQYNEKLKQLDQEIEKLDNEGRIDEADLKDLEYQQLQKEKKILINDIKNRKKTLAALEQSTKKTFSLEEQNRIKIETINRKKQEKKQLEQRGGLNDKIEELDQEINELYNSQELEENEEDYNITNQNRNRSQNRNRDQNRNRNQNRNRSQNRNQDQNQNNRQEVEQLYPSANAAYPFEPLNFQYSQNNQTIQQPQISKVQSVLQN